MKSLEMLDSLINRIKYLFYIDLKDDYEVKTIKADLEVFEIVINKKINIENIKTKLECWGNLEALLEFWNSLTSHKDSQLTMEELLKLKQWLEENENA